MARGPLMVITVSDGVFTDLVHVAFFFFLYDESLSVILFS